MKTRIYFLLLAIAIVFIRLARPLAPKIIDPACGTANFLSNPPFGGDK